MPVVRADGSVFGTLCALDPLPERAGDVDIELFELLATLIAQQLDAAEFAEERELFMGAVGHDLRTPIQNISHSARLIGMLAGELPDVVQAAQRIERGAHRLAAMVDDMVDLTRGRLGRTMPLAPEPLRVSDLLASVVAEYPRREDSASVVLEVSGDDAVTWDRARARQLVQNLVANACTHGAPDRPVTVRFDGSANPVRLSVHNLGTAIDPAALPRLFDPFFRAGTRREEAGLGLGLYIVTQIAKAHDGDVAVRSDDRHGTEFVVTLPRIAGAE